MLRPIFWGSEAVDKNRVGSSRRGCINNASLPIVFLEVVGQTRGAPPVIIPLLVKSSYCQLMAKHYDRIPHSFLIPCLLSD